MFVIEMANIFDPYKTAGFFFCFFLGGRGSTATPRATFVLGETVNTIRCGGLPNADHICHTILCL